jgi:hypothetical protein
VHLHRYIALKSRPQQLKRRRKPALIAFAAPQTRQRVVQCRRREDTTYHRWNDYQVW